MQVGAGVDCADATPWRLWPICAPLGASGRSCADMRQAYACCKRIAGAVYCRWRCVETRMAMRLQHSGACKMVWLAIRAPAQVAVASLNAPRYASTLAPRLAIPKARPLHRTICPPRSTAVNNPPQSVQAAKPSVEGARRARVIQSIQHPAAASTAQRMRA